MKIAIVHDQLQEFGGAERVLISLKKIYPDADVYTSYLSLSSLGQHASEIKNWHVKTSWADKVPFLKRLHSPFRFLAPFIWESFDFSKYNLVISSSATQMCKGVIVKPHTLHISYVHHPPRYLYGYETAMEWQKYWPVKIYGHLINHFLRMWDYTSSQRPHFLIANSVETQKRIKKFYRRDSTVIYPPVSIPLHTPNSSLLTPNYFITVSRLARAKHIDILVKTANKMKVNLKIVGSGRDETYLRSIAGPTVEFLTGLSDEELKNVYQKAKAFLFASVDEEFGIAPVEAMGYGIPVIAYSSGGLKETVIEGVNGYLYLDLKEESLIDKIKKLESLSEKEYVEIRNNARKESEKYTEEVFRKKIVEFVNEKLGKLGVKS